MQLTGLPLGLDDDAGHNQRRVVLTIFSLSANSILFTNEQQSAVVMIAANATPPGFEQSY
jgi:hypothetical protein